MFLVRAANSVIPEGAKRLSGIQKKGGYWIPDLDFVSSGMTTFYCLLQIKSKEKSSATDNGPLTISLFPLCYRIIRQLQAELVKKCS